MILPGWICLSLVLAAPAVDRAEMWKEFNRPQSPGYQLMFFAVVEGAYRDGLSGEHLSVILTREAPASYRYFIYACPLCTPVVTAFELYASRPRRLYSLKNAGSTFGDGIPESIAVLLQSEDDAPRRMGIQLLLERWVDAYLDSRNLPPDELKRWRESIEAAREEGRRLLQQYRDGGSVHLTAPAFAEEGECAACTGSFEGAWEASGMGPVVAPAYRGEFENLNRDLRQDSGDP